MPAQRMAGLILSNSTVSSVKSSRLGFRTTLEQEVVLRRAAEVCHKSLTEFIVDSAYQAAENALMELDRNYIDNWTLWLNMKILFQTIPSILKGV